MKKLKPAWRNKEYGVTMYCGERPPPPKVDDSGLDRYGTGNAGVHRKVGGQYQKWLDANPLITVGWKPTCKCGTDEVAPAIVLDPFAGAATTAVVAMRNGRRAVLIELNPEYAEIARMRVEDVGDEWF